MTPAELDAIEARNNRARAYLVRATEARVTPYISGDDVRAVIETVDQLLAEVRRLTPTPKPPPEPKVATWTTVEGRPNMRVLVCGGRDVAHYDHSGFGLWFVNVYGHGIASWATEDAARADVLAWAKSKGWEVRDGK